MISFLFVLPFIKLETKWHAISLIQLKHTDCCIPVARGMQRFSASDV